MPVSADGEGGTRLVSGETSRHKTVSLAGVPPERVVEWINPAA